MLYENAQLALELLGNSPDAPVHHHGSHLGHRTNYFHHPKVKPMGFGLELFGLRKDNAGNGGRGD